MLTTDLWAKLCDGAAQMETTEYPCDKAWCKSEVRLVPIDRLKLPRSRPASLVDEVSLLVVIGPAAKETCSINSVPMRINYTLEFTFTAGYDLSDEVSGSCKKDRGAPPLMVVVRPSVSDSFDDCRPSFLSAGSELICTSCRW